MQRQPVHDFGINMIAEDDNKFQIILSFPLDFDRPHLGSINIIKAAMEAAVEINQKRGLEERYSKKLLGEFFLHLGEEIEAFSEVIIEMQIAKIKERKSNLWQKWSFTIGQKNNGYFWACYLP